MALDSKHPAFSQVYPDWVSLAHAYAGERVVKDNGTNYLPATAGMKSGGQGYSDSKGEKAYQAYKLRAVFHNFLRDAIMGMLGIMHRKQGQVLQLPKKLDRMLVNMTSAGENIHGLWRRISESQLLYGRCGMLVDVPSNEEVSTALPYVSFYGATTITNWDTGVLQQGRQRLELVVLDESQYERSSGLTWEWRNNYRLLGLSDIVDSLTATDQDPVGGGQYVTGTTRGGVELPGEYVEPQLGGNTLDFIPFTFVNVTDIVPSPDLPPFLNLCNLCYAIYRGEADYRQNLFMQGQDTLVRTGFDDDDADEPKVGAGAVMDIPVGCDAKYIGVNSKGLPEQRTALENDKKLAASYAVQMLDTRKGLAESGDALKIRVAARTATLATMQLTAAAALRETLRNAAAFMGVSLDESEKIEVVPNLDFGDSAVNPQALRDLMEAKANGLPLSIESVHAFLKENEYTTFTYEAEKPLLDKEKAEKEEARKELAESMMGDPSEDDQVEEEEEEEEEEETE